MKVATPTVSGVQGIILPLMTATRADEVEQRIRQAISLGLLPDGQQLPSETALASRLGVSPMTLREALASLREQGLVETRRGRSGGTFVKRPASPQIRGLRDRLRQISVTSLRDLADEHMAIAGTAARLAAERASEANVRRLLGLIDQLSKAETLGSRIRADSRFHVDLAAASHSERLMHLEVALQGEIGDLLWLPMEPELDLGKEVRDHLGIATAVANEDAEQARLLAEQHVQSNFRRLTELHHALIVIGDGSDG
ncbi:MAG TPA: GntR family transcriptional regulator [Acidimicrobiales bacterium]|nr:GntR family transcriptional regulator [Acidimicrobiales bacterium]